MGRNRGTLIAVASSVFGSATLTHRSRAGWTRARRLLVLDGDLTEMLAGFLVPESICQALQAEAPVNDGLHAHDLDPPDHILLLVTAADDDPLQPGVFDHHEGQR